ncbi:MAG: phenylalanine--tRNA ligase subunit beta [Bacteroidota bacterium]
MKISFNWLKEYIKTDLSPVKVSEILTDIGLEFESINQYEEVKGGLNGLVVGQVKDCEKHPDADKLSVTKVDIGEDHLLDIVCGAPNVQAGQKVIVAPVGTTLYATSGEEFTIKKTKIRGEISEGMICAEDEIGLGTSHDGIIILDENTKIGLPASEYFNIQNDTVLEIGLTPNRIDAASHLGVARDLAAFLKQSEKISVLKPPVDLFKTENENLNINVTIENEDACPRYAGVSISGIQVKESPKWLKNKLKSIGLNPINNVVDVTNYVLHETGQPLHAFDADQLAGGKIIVKNLPKGTKFTTLDEVERDLSDEDLVICDEKGGIALAGIFGGLDSGVTSQTINIFLESAYFNPVSVRKTARRHGLNTDASFRFERGVDPNMTLYALKRSALLIKELAGGTISSNLVDVYPKPIKPYEIFLSYFNLKRLVGKELEKDKVKSILTSLDIEINKEHDKGLDLIVPPYRVDVQREADIVEEILRIYGYNNIKVETKLNSCLTYTGKPDQVKIMNLVSDYLSFIGCNEIWSNSLTKSSYYKKNNAYNPDQLVNILNPLSGDLDCMRMTLLFGGLEAITRNVNRQQPNLMLYEFGNVYQYKNDPDQKGNVNNYHEEMQLALFITGNKTGLNWINGEQKSSYFTIKSYVTNILGMLKIDIDSFKQEEVKNEIFNAGIHYFDKKNKIASIGILKPELLKTFGLDEEVFYAEFNWQEVINIYSKNSLKYKPIPKFPEVRRDLALLLEKNVPYKKLKEIAFQTEREFLKKMHLFDVYEGKGIEPGKKSYAISFTLQSSKNTLTDKQIEKIMNKLIEAFNKNLNAQIRK